jgi:hypothetical protein
MKKITHNLSEGLHNNNFKFEEHRVASLLPKSMNLSLTKEWLNTE